MLARPARQQIGRLLGIALLILAVGRVPLPRAEYHSIGHQDGPNQVCELHQHLLRWHPSAGPDDRIAVLHWHWFVPRHGQGDKEPDRDDGPPVALTADDAIADEAPSPATDAIASRDAGPVVAPPHLLTAQPLALPALGERPPRPIGAAATFGDTPAARPADRLARLLRRTC